MQQRNTNANATATLVPSTRSTSVQQDESVHARLVTFCSPSPGSLSIVKNDVEHRYVPRPFVESDFTFESCLVAFKIISLFLQYLLIYKSEKWFSPNGTSTDSFLHWQHIDRCVIVILVIFCISLQDRLYILKVIINIIALVYSLWMYSWKYVLLFTYPLVCSLLIYQDQNPKSHQSTSSISSNSLPGHWCSSSAYDLRYETDCLHIELLQRVRHVLFSSFLSSYYICIVSFAFCNTHYIRLDVTLLFQFGLTLFLSLVMFYTSHYLPLELLTVFHRNGKHLGSWNYVAKVHHSHHALIIPSWDEKNSTAYQPNSVVKHKQSIYRSANTCTTVAEPGNIYHERFAILFNRPWMFSLILGVLQLVLLILQLTLLFIDPRWFVVLSQIILFIFNTYTIHHTIRDMYLLYLVYC